MLLAAVVFLFSAGYYVLIWQPLSERIRATGDNVAAAGGDEHPTEERRAGYLRRENPGTTTPAQVCGVISDSARHEVVIKRIAERGENIRVWIDPVVFNDLLKWLNALDENIRCG